MCITLHGVTCRAVTWHCIISYKQIKCDMLFTVSEQNAGVCSPREHIYEGPGLTSLA